VSERSIAWLALALYALWGVVAFAIRSVIQIRRTGDSGFRGGGSTGSAEWWARLVFTSALLLGALAPVGALLGLSPVDALDATTLRLIGAGIAAAGVAATFFAQTVMGDSWRIGVDYTERTELVISGPFRFVRNPIFTAMAVTAGGLTLLVPNWLALVGFLMLLCGLEFQVRRVEEPFLLSMHGDAYAQYAARVGRFVPLVGRGRRLS
jgi:protein-S-isoprenylcysteine O-methyltransferase Ste14